MNDVEFIQFIILFQAIIFILGWLSFQYSMWYPKRKSYDEMNKGWIDLTKKKVR